MSTWTEIATATNPASTDGIDSDNLDRLLLERIARHDRTAMQQLFERHHARISGFFRGLALDDEVSDRLTVDTFLTAWDSATNFHCDLPVSIWLLALGNRCVLRSIRTGRHQPDPGAMRIDDSGSQVKFEELGRAEWIRALSHLPIAQRVALELTYHLGHSCREVASITGSSEADVRLHVFFGRRKLYTLLTVAAPHRDEGGVGVPKVQARALSGGILRPHLNPASATQSADRGVLRRLRRVLVDERLRTSRSWWGADGLKRH